MICSLVLTIVLLAYIFSILGTYSIVNTMPAYTKPYFLFLLFSFGLNNSIVDKTMAATSASFDIVALGTDGGVNSHNLSAFLIGPHRQNVSVACDAGSLVSGIQSGVNAGNFANISPPADYPYSLSGYILREHIKAYLITHAHADHVMGLIVASVDDTNKSIYALAPVLQILQSSYFNWQAWPNFGNTGAAPQLGKYAYQTLQINTSYSIANTPMTVTALPLSHSGVMSTAFVIEYKNSLVVCIGDTGPDSVEKSDYLKKLWHFIAPALQQKQVKAIIIESSFTNEKPDKQLFGHLTPRYIHEELQVLAKIAGDSALLQNLPIIISHIKPSLKREQVSQKIAEQLESENTMGINFIIPEQGQRFHF